MAICTLLAVAAGSSACTGGSRQEILDSDLFLEKVYQRDYEALAVCLELHQDDADKKGPVASEAFIITKYPLDDAPRLIIDHGLSRAEFRFGSGVDVQAVLSIEAINPQVTKVTGKALRDSILRTYVAGWFNVLDYCEVN